MKHLLQAARWRVTVVRCARKTTDLPSPGYTLSSIPRPNLRSKEMQKKKAMNNTQRPVTRLPPEILASVISQGFAEESDLVFLWTALRNVNHQFRDLVQDYVRKNQLKRTYITYRIQGDTPGNDDDDSGLWLTCRGVDLENPSVAVFTYDKEMSSVPASSEHRLERLQDKLRTHPPNDWAYPPHMLAVERYVNDTELCGFNLVATEKEGFEVRITWTDTFTRLLTEEKLRQSMSRRWVCNQA